MVVVQEIFPGAIVVNGFNDSGYRNLEPDRRSAGHLERLGLAMAVVWTGPATVTCRYPSYET